MPIARRSAIHLIVIVVHTGDAIDGCAFCESNAQTVSGHPKGTT
jgi:hypothetical protein